ncbi:MAG: bi-domain-containing oxidoreductase [Gemmatimonadota bacterium]|nr:bi-domain-containing oxidoreductase [Gemmatimonadota bacterium]
MKAVIQDLDRGELRVGDVPPPALQPGGILVAVRRSLISIGTERAVIELARKGPIGKALDRPDLARKVINKAKQEGYWSTYNVVRNLIKSPIPLGYSCAGDVIAVGAKAGDFRVGDRVACAGLSYANHAEVNYIPRNLAAKMPEGVAYDDACFVTLGAIAMQGVRLAEIELSERVLVLGLGLVGQVAAQLARRAGATVFVHDLDPSKVEMAMELGAHAGESAPDRLVNAVASFTGGHGADAVLVCAATRSDDPLRLAAEVSRLKGRVIVVGDVGMKLRRRPFFEKELRLIVSRSYGPGRYDPAYEVHGVDYPLPYVRWTEQRNMQSFLELIAQGDLRLAPLVTHRYQIEDAETAYRVVTGESQERAVAIILEYSAAAPPAKRVELKPARSVPAGNTVRLGVIGAGQFAKGVLLPAFARIKGVRLDAFCTASGLTSRAVGEAYGARYCTSEPAEVLADPAIDAVIIATRHDQHPALVADALRAGKVVFVEKPLAITESALEELTELLDSLESPRLMVGFNRRFAPLAVRARDFFAGRRSPLFVSYRVNAGTFPPDSWVFDPAVGGGRILGEVCHFIDTICYLTGSLPARVFAEEVHYSDEPAYRRDSLSITMRMEDGSVGAIHYLADGDPSVPKEYMEAYADGRTTMLDNYRKLALHSGNRRRGSRLLNQAKGHAEEAAAFIAALRSGEPMPIPIDTLIAVTRAAFLVHRSLDTGAPVDFATPAGATAALERL